MMMFSLSCSSSSSSSSSSSRLLLLYNIDFDSYSLLFILVQVRQVVIVAAVLRQVPGMYFFSLDINDKLHNFQKIKC